MLELLNSSVNDINLKLSSPSSGITLGPSFTPLKDLVSSSDFQNDEVCQMQALLKQAENISCSITAPKCSRSLFLDSKRAEPKMTEIAVEKIDPTQKNLKMLTKSLLEQQQMAKMNAAKKKKSESLPICFEKREPLKKLSVKSLAKTTTKPMKRKTEKIAAKRDKPAKKVKIAHQNSSQSTTSNDFGNLRMVPLEQYNIPVAISDIETQNDTTNLPAYKQIIEASGSDASHYFDGYSALLYLVETAESIYLHEFNQKHIRLSYSGVNTSVNRSSGTFQIKNSVSFTIFCSSMNFPM